MRLFFPAIIGVLSLLSGDGLVAALTTSDILTDVPVTSLLSSAHGHLSKGEFEKAIIYYDAVISRDASDSVTFFKRATAYLSLGRTSQATDDFHRVLQISPNFEGAHLQLAKISARVADWDGAREHYANARRPPQSPEVLELSAARESAKLAESAERTKSWADCVEHATVAIKFAPRAASLREVRARCQFELGQVEAANIDLQHVVHLKPGEIAPHVKISATTLYSLGDIETSRAQTRRCLHSDPDSKVCRKLLKRLKSIEKAIERAEKALGNDRPMVAIRVLQGATDEPGLVGEVREDMEELLKDGTLPAAAPRELYSKLVRLSCQGYFKASSPKADSLCAESLELYPSSLYGLLHLAKTQLDKELYEAAMETYKKAAEAHRDVEAQVIKPLYQEALRALQRSKTKDYYKVLGVPRDSDDRQIKSAYRKLSKQYHPDKAMSQGFTKEESEKKMAQLNEAYEVLIDPELRARFDRGDDPNAQHTAFDPYQRHDGGPFMYQAGGSGPFHFKFTGGGFPFGY